MSGSADQRGGRVLFVTAVRLRRGPRGLQLDDQTCAGLARWAESFGHVTYMGIEQPADLEDNTSVTWIDIADLDCRDRLTVVALPFAYKIGRFFKDYKSTRKMLGEEIAKADHLCFTLGYLFGDWAAVAALEAIRQNRDYAVWFDRVEHDVIRRTLPAIPLKRRIKEVATLPVMVRYHHYLIRHSNLGLFQGQDTLNAYADHSKNPHCVYDVHTQSTDLISAAALEEKAERVQSGAALKILYVGRASEMKGPLDWIEAIAKPMQSGVPLRAKWVGDGPLLADMKQRISALELEDQIELPGFSSDREAILAEMRDADLFVYCHKTQESPRCLIEALVSGCPIVGYQSSYSDDLVSQNGGGVGTPLNDPAALSATIQDLHENRSKLAQLIKAAAADGSRFDEQTLYAHRADLIREYA
ncbi:glycosyltransferase [Roseibium sp.]|uniref:glycosyltransferase n=1 Tax=Roseibium sp. TaxID=1936156 RepID=UPI00391D4A9A